VQKSILTLSLLALFQPALAQENQTNNDTQEESKKEAEVIRVVGSKEAGIELSSEKILKVPGAGNDPLRAVESLPGVVLANGFAPAVRGSSPNDMYYQTDDVPVGNVFHNDGSSTLYPNLIQSFELKTGAWESEFFDSVGGVIDTKLRDPKMAEFSGSADFSLLRVGALVESQLTETSAFYFAARQSLIHLYIDALLDDEDFSFTQAPINNDYQFKYINNINPDNKITVQATGSNDDVELLFSDDSKFVKQNPDLKGGIGAASYYHNQSVVWLNESDYGQTKVITNRLERSADFQIGQIVDLDAITTDYLLKVHNTQLIGNGLLKAGLDYRQQNVDYTVSGKSSPCNQEFEECAPTYYSDSTSEQDVIDINFVSAFADYDWDFADSVTLRLGGVYSYNSFTEQGIVEPRLGVNWQLNADYKVKLGYGKHHQWFREYKYLSETFGAVDLKQVESTHYVAGIQYEGLSDWAWRLEAYYKDMDKLIVSNPEKQATDQSGAEVSDPNVQSYINGATGKAYGIEFLINKAISNDWYGWLSIAYSKTERENQITGDSFNYAFDLPWIVNVVMNYEIAENWQLGARWRYQSGSLYTPIEGAAPVYPLGENGQPDTNQEVVFYDPIEGGFNSQRLDTFHRLDVRVDYETYWWGLPTNIYFEVLNLYGQKSLVGYDYNEDYTEKEPEYQFPEMPIPSVGIQIEF
jgi:hypothetical protein